MALRAVTILLMATVVNCSGCDRIYTAESGTIRSPGSLGYPHNVNCTYVIKGSSRIRAVQFTFERFRTETNYDFLYIGNDKFHGSEPKGKQLNYTFSNSFTLRFISDRTNTYSGFVIKYKLLTECIAGFYGQNCSRCNSGCSDVCNPETGMCICKKGKTGSKCESVCPSGTYDSYCTKICNPGCLDGSCNKEDGNCSCKSGYKGPRCESMCSHHRYGPDCKMQCSFGCELSNCDSITGFCECLPGWTGEKCDQECVTGMYGLNCNKSCSSGCVNTCSKQNGKCNCRAGRKGDTCDAECPADRHGVNCESSCSPGCEDGACDSESGLCTCTAGWMGDKCLEECENTTYGAYCKHKCSDGCINDMCNAVHGSCSCINGYLGDRCSFDMIVIASVSVGVLAAILIAVCVFFLISWRRKKEKKESVLEKTDAVTMKNITIESPECNENVGCDDVDDNGYEDVTHMYMYDDGQTLVSGTATKGHGQTLVSGTATKGHGQTLVSGTATNGHGQTSVTDPARNTDRANEESLYENEHTTGYSGRVGGAVAYHSGIDDVEEEHDYEDVEPRR